MVLETKTFNFACGAYEAPQCNVYKVALESVIAISGGGGINNADEEDYGEI